MNDVHSESQSECLLVRIPIWETQLNSSVGVILTAKPISPSFGNQID